MKENKLVKILIPIIAVIVVFESVMLVSNLENSPKNNNLVDETNVGEKAINKTEVEESVADFIWETDSLEMKVGKTYNITLNLLSKKDLVLDSVETHVYFDPKLVTLSKLVTNKEIGEELKATGIDNKTGLVSGVLWSGDDKGVGYEAKNGKSVEVLSFMVTPVAEGKVEFDLSTSTVDKKFASIIVETNTNKPWAYSSNKLEINVTK
jgi:hypothetical protein